MVRVNGADRGYIVNQVQQICYTKDALEQWEKQNMENGRLERGNKAGCSAKTNSMREEAHFIDQLSIPSHNFTIYFSAANQLPLGQTTWIHYKEIASIRSSHIQEFDF